MYLLPFGDTPLKPVSLLEDGTSSSPSAAAAALASSAVSGCCTATLASAASAAALRPNGSKEISQIVFVA